MVNVSMNHAWIKITHSRKNATVSVQPIVTVMAPEDALLMANVMIVCIWQRPFQIITLTQCVQFATQLVWLAEEQEVMTVGLVCNTNSYLMVHVSLVMILARPAMELLNQIVLHAMKLICWSPEIVLFLVMLTMETSIMIIKTVCLVTQAARHATMKPLKIVTLVTMVIIWQLMENVWCLAIPATDIITITIQNAKNVMIHAKHVTVKIVLNVSPLISLKMENVNLLIVSLMTINSMKAT
jgi:hypothetical protein